MNVQPKYHWQLKERKGTTIVDTVSGVKAELSNATWLGHGRIGRAIKIDGKKRILVLYLVMNPVGLVPAILRWHSGLRF